ncbi:hypothetical protein R6Q59_014023 [Mikania micrantha]
MGASLAMAPGGIAFKVPAFEKNHGLRPCMVAPTKIITGLGLSLGIDILEALRATGDYRTLLTSKATAIAKALSTPMRTCPNVFVRGEDEHKPGVSDGYDFGFLHIKVMIKQLFLKSKGLEAVDKAIGQLARLLWEAESTAVASSPHVLTADPPHRFSSPRRRFSPPILPSTALLTAAPPLAGAPHRRSSPHHPLSRWSSSWILNLRA